MNEHDGLIIFLMFCSPMLGWLLMVGLVTLGDFIDRTTDKGSE